MTVRWVSSSFRNHQHFYSNVLLPRNSVCNGISWKVSVLVEDAWLFCSQLVGLLVSGTKANASNMLTLTTKGMPLFSLFPPFFLSALMDWLIVFSLLVFSQQTKLVLEILIAFASQGALLLCKSCQWHFYIFIMKPKSVAFVQCTTWCRVVRRDTTEI